MTFAEACAAAASAWPALGPPDGAFEAFVRERATDDADLAQLRVADLFLAYRALLGDPAAIGELRAILDQLRGALLRTGAGAAAAGELIADLPADLVARRGDLAPRLAAYGGRGPLAGWLRVVAVRALVDRRRRAGVATDDEMVEELAAPELDPELALLRRRYAAELGAAFSAAVAGLDPLDRLLLRQRYLDGLGIDRLAALHGIHRATAARRLAGIRGELSAAVRRILLAKLGVADATLDSIIRLVGGELEVGLDRYL
jgi:RNA polymerase sigma-70 factor (ECF subfamily)